MPCCNDATTKVESKSHASTHIPKIILVSYNRQYLTHISICCYTHVDHVQYVNKHNIMFIILYNIQIYNSYPLQKCHIPLLFLYIFLQQCNNNLYH